MFTAGAGEHVLGGRSEHHIPSPGTKFCQVGRIRRVQFEGVVNIKMLCKMPYKDQLVHELNLKKNFADKKEVKMRIICIIGSARSNGSTAAIVDKIIEGMRESNVEVSRYCLGDMNVNFCLGCKKCYEYSGRCIQNDDMDTIMSDLLKSDIVVIASPSYWGDITGQLKVFFDRSTPYCDTNENRIAIQKGKKGISVAIRAGQSDRENIHIIESIEHYYGHLGITPIASLSIKGVNTIDDLYSKEDEINRAYELGKNIINLV
ncbi:flavodoxin family protein [Alkaliphilus serpentinus]|uniref:Flavodoxin family protein n=1 Tax=Alkaliphilus serpentinus TaxID=1482731 RepID=A0A833HL25_9FIRM|nr:flavodoxin family protein [Alkaliphilus serpentinus]KAB3524821.1 flavodoxin family protein [Alkaliphilus serpentinus]